MSEHSNGKKPCFCKECGTKLQKIKDTTFKNCSTEHARYKTYGHKYCKNCGKKL